MGERAAGGGERTAGAARWTRALARMWGMRMSVVPSPHPAGASLVRPELLDDLAVMVAGPAGSRVRHDLLGHVSRGVVFVVAAQPAHGLIAVVAALGDAVEHRVVAPQARRAPG